MKQQRQEEIAINRLNLISPLLDPTLDQSKRQAIKNEICLRSGLSERTIRRYFNVYMEEGFDGLKPKSQSSGRKTCLSQEIIDEAIALRREVPKRSINEIIQILEWEGICEQGQIKRSTLQSQLSYHGYSSRQMKTYAKSNTSSRRYQKPWRNYLWQSDIKYGPYINGKPTYMVCFMDDCSRHIMHSEFYPSLDQKIVQDCFRKALIKWGLPLSVYFDNGKQYRNKWMTRACARLGIRLLYAKPYSPEGKGKQERFNQTVDGFIREAIIAKPKNLDELNHLYHVWLDECYLNKPHASLNGKTPYEVYQSDIHEIHMADANVIADAFLSCETRKVDKTGCISFFGEKYEIETGLLMIHKNVDVIFDPSDISVVPIECEGFPPSQARPIIISANTSGRPSLPDHLTGLKPQSSRLLDAAVQQNQNRLLKRKTAISFSDMLGGEL